MMKFMKILTLIISVLILLSAADLLQAQGISKTIQIGYKRAKIVDSGDEGEGSWGWGQSFCYYDGFGETDVIAFSSKAIFFGCKDWVDTLGATHSVKLSGHGQWETDDRHIFMPVPDDQGWTIHRYMRQQPPPITVDGLRMDDPYPFNQSDHVEADKIPGTADILIESTINTDMGMTIHQRVVAFSQAHHDDYHIVEWVLKNTGNVDLDENIELPDQTIKDFYFLKQLRPFENPRTMLSSYGEKPDEDMWLLYGYPQRQEGDEFDTFGGANEVAGYLNAPHFVGETLIFASKNVNDMTTNDPNQPSMTAYHDVDYESVTRHSMNLTESQTQGLYEIMQSGFADQPKMTDAKPGNHSVRFDDQGYKHSSDFPAFGYHMSHFYAHGPYTLAPGDSIKFVWAEVIGTISSEKAWEIGQQWLADDIPELPPGITSTANDNLPPHYKLYPELYADDAYASEQTNWAKDCWVMTGKDSIFNNARAAKWAYEHNFNVPQPPPPPSIEVTSFPDKVLISWGNESEAAGDFAGYRVYRSVGNWAPIVPYGETELIGGWEKIFETSGSGVHSYEDTEAQRGIAHFYYVTAFDNANEADYDGVSRSLESGIFWNMALKAGYLTKPAADNLDDIIIVPNPYNLGSSEKQWIGEPNKIMFLNLPLECTIRVFNESGDLMKTIEHSGSGDEPWGDLLNEHMATDSDQIVVSGIYIAHFECPDGKSAVKKFVIVR